MVASSSTPPTEVMMTRRLGMSVHLFLMTVANEQSSK
jgi:hypothetical protein